MNKAQIEENQLAKVRNVAMDVGATFHIMEAYKQNKPWTCMCFCCEYIRTNPRLVDTIQKSIKNEKTI